MAFPPRLVAGRYRLEELVGEGSMSTVYRAFDTRLRRQVAVKILRRHLVLEPASVARFRQEARAAASLSHPNVVSVFDWGIEGQLHYLVMEFVDGPSLERLLGREGRLTPEESARIAAATAAGLEAAHEQGIVHRDVKPGNILLDGSGRVRVADFGIARVVGATAVTRPGAVLGSVPYLSPEQAVGDEVGAPSDIYSLGVVLFEMLTGRRPFEAPSSAEAAIRRLHVDPPAPSSLVPGIPAALDRATRRAMAREPAKRYPTVGEFRSDLERWHGRRSRQSEAAAGLGGAAAGIGGTAAGPKPSDAAASNDRRLEPSADSAETLTSRAAAGVPAQPSPDPETRTQSETEARLGPASSGPVAAIGPAAAAWASTRAGSGDPGDAGQADRPLPGAPTARGHVPAAAAGQRAPRPAPALSPAEQARPNGQQPVPPSRDDRLRRALLAAVILGGATLLLLFVTSPFGQKPKPTHEAIAGVTATPTIGESTATPSATLPPNTKPPAPAPTPGATPAPTPPAAAASPAQVVASFYALVAAHRFNEAASLWSPSMQQRYPPVQNIDQRFADTTGIDIRRDDVVAVNGDQASVAVDLVEFRDVAPTEREFAGSWQLVTIGGRWLMNQPNF